MLRYLRPVVNCIYGKIYTKKKKKKKYSTNFVCPTKATSCRLQGTFKPSLSPRLHRGPMIFAVLSGKGSPLRKCRK